MKQLTCEMCGSTNLMKQDGVFVCQSCGCKYSVEEARKMMVEGTVDVRGTVTVDNSAAVEKYLDNARRALDKKDWEEVEKYYNLVEVNSKNNIEAVFFSAYGRVMLSMWDEDYPKRQQKFEVLNRSMSVISDYFEETTENKEEVLRRICSYITYMYTSEYVYQMQAINIGGALRSVAAVLGSKKWCDKLIESTKDAFLEELRQIAEKHDEPYIRELIGKCEFRQSVISEQPTEPGLLRTMICRRSVYGKRDLKLYVYTDYIVLASDSGEILFNHSYREIKSLKNSGWFSPLFMTLTLNDGTAEKFVLDGRGDALELPGRIEKLIHS